MKRKLKSTALTALAITALFCLSGCGKSEITDDTEGSEMREVASNGLGKIYVVEIDGAEYVVVLGSYKAAITPKIND